MNSVDRERKVAGPTKLIGDAFRVGQDDVGVEGRGRASDLTPEMADMTNLEPGVRHDSNIQRACQTFFAELGNGFVVVGLKYCGEELRWESMDGMVRRRHDCLRLIEAYKGIRGDLDSICSSDRRWVSRRFLRLTRPRID